MNGTVMGHTLGAQDHAPQLTEGARQLLALPGIQATRVNL